MTFLLFNYVVIIEAVVVVVVVDFEFGVALISIVQVAVVLSYP